MRKELWYEKAACKILVKLTVMPKFLSTALKCLQFGFLIFWRKDFGTKAAYKMWVKLTPSLLNLGAKLTPNSGALDEVGS